MVERYQTVSLGRRQKVGSSDSIEARIRIGRL